MLEIIESIASIQNFSSFENMGRIIFLLVCLCLMIKEISNFYNVERKALSMSLNATLVLVLPLFFGVVFIRTLSLLLKTPIFN